MTANILPKSTGEAIAEISARLYKVEQRSAAPNAGAPQNPNPSVDTITVDGIVVGSTASPASGLILTAGAHMEDIWIDASWTAPADGTAANYDVELCRKVGASYELVQNYRTGTGTSIRMAGLEPTQTYGVRVIAINRIGVRATPTPATGFSDVTTGLDATVPEQTSNLQLTAGIRTVMATWNEVVDRDVARGTGTYEVQLATDSGFTALFASKFTSATITSFSGVATSTQYWGRVRAVDNSGNAGPWSASASVTTVPAGTGDIGTGAVQTTNIANLAVGNAQIADAAIDNAKIADLSADKITAGTINADRIAANSLDVNKLTTSTLTSKTITIGAGGVLKIGNAPTTGILINDQGIRLYSGGVVKVSLDVAGTANFEGNINASTITSSTLTSATINSGTITGVTITGATVRTAASGKRVAFESGVQDRIKLYTGQVNEAEPASLQCGSGGSLLEVSLIGPRATGGHAYPNIALQAYDTSTGDTQIMLQIRNGDHSLKSSVRLINQGSGESAYIYCGGWLERMTLDFNRTGTNADMALKGSGDYCFIYMRGGGFASTINTVAGLGSGIHILDGTNGSFHPIQASAFNVASSQATKRNITDEEPVLGKLMRVKVKRFQRVYDDKMKDAPAHIQRAYDLREVGFMAEELASIEPDAVAMGADGPTGINLAHVVGMLVKAVQELNGQIQEKK